MNERKRSKTSYGFLRVSEDFASKDLSNSSSVFKQTNSIKNSLDNHLGAIRAIREQ